MAARHDSPPGRHWKIALCSLSMGSSAALPSRTASMKKRPAITSDSLFASSTRLPARAAAIVGISPAAPTMAAITTSVCGCAATSTRPASPSSTSTRSPSARTAARNAVAAAWSATTAYSGAWTRHCASSSRQREPQASANTR